MKGYPQLMLSCNWSWSPRRLWSNPQLSAPLCTAQPSSASHGPGCPSLYQSDPLGPSSWCERRGGLQQRDRDQMETKEGGSRKKEGAGGVRWWLRGTLAWMAWGKVLSIVKFSNVKVHSRQAGVSNEAYCLQLAASDLWKQGLTSLL